MIKNLLVLRNKTSQKRTNEFFKAHDINFYSQNISESEILEIDLAGIEADIVLITSHNSLVALKQNLDYLKNKKIYCLSSHVMDFLNKQDGLNVFHKNWDRFSNMANDIIKNESPNQKIIHICADNTNVNYYKSLINKGFSIDSIVGYKTTFIDTFEDDVIRSLKNKEIEYIMSFSKASLDKYIEVINQNNLNINDYKIIAFSEKIAEGKTPYFSKNCKLDDMLELYLDLNKKG